jgi:hypothetical protein
MIEPIIKYGVITVIVLLMLGYLKKNASKNFKTENGQLILRMNKLYAVLAVILFITGLFIVILIIATHESFFIAVFFFLIFCVSGLICWIYYKNHQVTFNDKMMTVRNFSGKITSIQWKAIHNISFNLYTGLIHIIDTSRTHVKIHSHLVGLVSFIKIMEEKTSWRATKLKIPISAGKAQKN